MTATIEEIRATEWYKTRPQVIKDAIELLPPNKVYRIKKTGDLCHLHSFHEPSCGHIDAVRVTVVKLCVHANDGQLATELHKVHELAISELEPANEFNDGKE